MEAGKVDYTIREGAPEDPVLLRKVDSMYTHTASIKTKGSRLVVDIRSLTTDTFLTGPFRHEEEFDLIFETLISWLTARGDYGVTHVGVVNGNYYVTVMSRASGASWVKTEY